jgi:hypothetical protein
MYLHGDIDDDIVLITCMLLKWLDEHIRVAAHCLVDSLLCWLNVC